MGGGIQVAERRMGNAKLTFKRGSGRVAAGSMAEKSKKKTIAISLRRARIPIPKIVFKLQYASKYLAHEAVVVCQQDSNSFHGYRYAINIGS